MGVSRSLRTTARQGTILVALFSLTSCAFEPAITPIPWPTVPGQSFGQSGSPPAPGVSPIPIAPTPGPARMAFQGAEDLDCGSPQVDDPRYGYCSIPGTNQYYIWVPCEGPCPDSPYLGMQVRRVDDSSELQRFINLANQRSNSRESEGDFRVVGVGLGLGEAIVGALTFGGACLTPLGAFSFGTSCLAWFVGAGFGLGGIGYSDYRANEEGAEAVGNEIAMEDTFSSFPEATPAPPSQ